jgi:predicted AlkP superfamily pyrophosphatase or phosphodiesterase
MTIQSPDYTNSILNVTHSILRHYQAPSSHPSHPALDRWLEDKDIDHLILVLFDGLGMNALTHHLDENTALRRHLLSPITSVFPPTTVAATTTVLTGRPPHESGHVGWVQYFPKEQTNLVVFQNTDFFTGEVAPYNLKETYLSAPNLYELIQQGSPDVATFEIFPSFREGGSNSFPESVERVLLEAHHADRSFHYVYWTEPDLTEHVHGITSPKTGEVIRQLDQDFAELLANLPPRSAVLAIADHGLIDVEALPLHADNGLLDLLRQPPTIEPRTTAFFVKDGEHETFQQRFLATYGRWFRLYTRAEILASGLFGGGPRHPMLEATLGDFVSVAIRDKMFALSDKTAYKGHHAGLTEGEMMVPLIACYNQ